MLLFPNWLQRLTNKIKQKSKMRKSPKWMKLNNNTSPECSCGFSSPCVLCICEFRDLYLFLFLWMWSSSRMDHHLSLWFSESSRSFVITRGAKKSLVLNDGVMRWWTLQSTCIHSIHLKNYVFGSSIAKHCPALQCNAKCFQLKENGMSPGSKLGIHRWSEAFAPTSALCPSTPAPASFNAQMVPTLAKMTHNPTPHKMSQNRLKAFRIVQ